MTDSKRILSLTPMSMVKPKRQRFFWYPYAPLGTMTNFAGRGGEGKSTYALSIAAKATNGLLEGEFKGRPQSVILVGHEDDLGTIVMPRLMAAGADTDRVFAMSIKTTVEGIDLQEVPSLAEDLSRIREAIEETAAKLIIIDPLTSMMGGANLDKTADVRKSLNPFTALAAELDIAVIAIMHFRKGQGDTRDMLSGSHAFRDVARSVILFATDEESGQRIATVDKSNYSEARGESFAFNLVSARIELEDGEVATVARIQELGVSTVSVSDIVNRVPETALGEEMGKVVACVNKHPEGIEPSAVVEELGIDGGTVRSYLSRAATRGLIKKMAYGKYAPTAAPSQSLSSAAPASLAALHPYIDPTETTAADETPRQARNTAALTAPCTIHGTPTLNGTCGRCEAGIPA
jgi:hypothetical protein